MYFEVKHLILRYCKVRFLKCSQSQVSTLQVRIQVYFFFTRVLTKNQKPHCGISFLTFKEYCAQHSSLE